MLFNEFFNCQIPLTAPLAELSQQLCWDTSDLKASITSLRVTLALDFVAYRPDLAGQSIAIDLRQVGPAFVDIRRLQSLPAALRAIEGQVCRNCVRVQLRSSSRLVS